MITAKLNGELINCYDGELSDTDLREHSTNGEILCPACGGRYEYCNGEFVTAYFRHRSKDECDRFSEPETEEHSLGKRKLFEWIRNQNGVSDAILEGWIPETRQRPDIMFTYKECKYVIEYQCTPIATEWAVRNQLYVSVGIHAFWVLGTKNYLWYQDSSGSKSKRVKRIEESTPIYFDSALDIFLCSDTPGKLGFKYSFHNNTITDLLECISKWSVGTLLEKSELVCANISFFKFERKILHDSHKNELHGKVINRLINLKREIYNMCPTSLKSQFPNSSFIWRSANIESVKLSGRWTGEFTVYKKFKSGVEFPISGKFLIWYDLDKYGLEWKTNITIGNRTYETYPMPTNVLHTYLNVALPIRIRQILRCLYDSPYGCRKKWKSIEDFDPANPYEFDRNKVPEYRVIKNG